MLFLKIIRICAIDRQKERFYRHMAECSRALDRIEKQAVKLGPEDIGELQQAVKPIRDLLMSACKILKLSDSPSRYLQGAKEVIEELKNPKE